MGACRVAGDGAAVDGQRAEIADAATASQLGRVARDGDAREGCRSALFVEQTAATFSAGVVVTAIVRDNTSGHGECTTFSVADAAATVIGYVIGDVDIGKRHNTSLIDEGTTSTTPAAFQRAARQVERSALANGDDLTATFATLCELTVQRVAAEVDGHRRACCNT